MNSFLQAYFFGKKHFQRKLFTLRSVFFLLSSHTQQTGLFCNVTFVNHTAGWLSCMCEITCSIRDFHKLWHKIQNDLSVEDNVFCSGIPKPPWKWGLFGGVGLRWVGGWGLCRVTAPSGIFLLCAAWRMSPALSPDWESDPGVGRPVELAAGSSHVKSVCIRLSRWETGRKRDGGWMETIRCNVTWIQTMCEEMFNKFFVLPVWMRLLLY